MYSLSTREEFNKLIENGLIHGAISSNILGDLVLIKELDSNYYASSSMPKIYILDKKEFNDFGKLSDIVSLDDYEYKDLVYLNDECIIFKYLYLLSNGESGIYVYVINHFGELNERFTGDKYLTRNAKNILSNELIFKLLKLIENNRDTLSGKIDYLQVFKISNVGKNGQDKLKVIHSQEYPNYTSIHYFENIKCENCKLFWISDRDENGKEFSTLMLAEDY